MCVCPFWGTSCCLHIKPNLPATDSTAWRRSAEIAGALKRSLLLARCVQFFWSDRIWLDPTAHNTVRRELCLDSLKQTVTVSQKVGHRRKTWDWHSNHDDSSQSCLRFHFPLGTSASTSECRGVCSSQSCLPAPLPSGLCPRIPANLR
jgi:hypothetical protein